MNILVTGGAGQVGRELQRHGTLAGHALQALDRTELDITDAAAVAACISSHTPDLVINAAAYTAVDKAEQDAEMAFAINRDGAANLARACAAQAIPLLHISTDYVFDGHKKTPYHEDDPVAPLGVYGASKWQGEQQIRAHCSQHIILRTSWVFGAYGQNFVRSMLRLAREREELRVVADQRGCPTPASAIAQVVLNIAGQLAFSCSSVFGTYHYCGSPATSWHGFAEAVVAEARSLTALTVQRVVPISTAEYPTPAARPANSILDCSRLQDVFAIQSGDWRPDLRETLTTWLRSA